MARNNTQKKKKCEDCDKEYVLTNFYNTNSVLSRDGKLNICKKCTNKMINVNDIKTIYKVLQLMDVPFFYDYWRSSKEKSPDNPWGNYIRMANSKINEFNGTSWKDSIFQPVSENKIIEENNQVIDEIDIDFDITQEMIVRWGKGHPKEVYMKLEDFYIKMKEANKIETPQDEFYLKKLAKISLKMDEELENGNYGQAKSLGDLFSKYMADSQFRAMDKTDADKTGGLRGFGVIYAEVEKDDFIPPWEHYRKLKGVNQDIVDKTIMHICNFVLRLNKIETMISPPNDTPVLDKDEEDIEVIANDINEVII